MAVSLLRTISALKGDEAAYELDWPWTALDRPLHLHSQSHAWLSVQPETRPHGGSAPGRRLSPHEDGLRASGPATYTKSPVLAWPVQATAHAFCLPLAPPESLEGVEIGGCE